MDHEALLLKTGKAIAECAQRIATFHSEKIIRLMVKDAKSDHFLREYHSTLEMLLNYLDGGDGIDESDRWMGQCLREIEALVEILRLADNERAFAKGAREFDVRHPDDCKSECFWTEARHGMTCPQGGCDGIRITK